jgi:hypothetical protein
MGEVKLTATMLAGLAKMAAGLKKHQAVMAEPNEATGRALLKRGLIEVVVDRSAWPLYRITDAGRAALSQEERT